MSMRAGVTIADGISGQEAVVLSAGPFLNPGQKVNPKRQAAARTGRKQSKNEFP